MQYGPTVFHIIYLLIDPLIDSLISINYYTLCIPLGLIVSYCLKLEYQFRHGTLR